ncbi:hypothetical protein Tco_1032706 [Tanacetum coccineum]|uniref:Uncharacterized protein n=1 Tax=Tanacetum coccineum TaxID=301880 RepID=A0ABQ5GD62_9ASTR
MEVERLLLNPKRTLWVLLKTIRTLWCGGCGGGQRGGEDGCRGWCHDGRGGDDDGGGVMVSAVVVLKASVGWQRRLDGWGGARVEWRWLRVVVEAGGRPETRRNLAGYGKEAPEILWGGRSVLYVLGFIRK